MPMVSESEVLRSKALALFLNALADLVENLTPEIVAAVKDRR